jgi:coenzyme F420-0:L-glutamate ligase / coenzyme F420-1:gamma-L-glutamate ligase
MHLVMARKLTLTALSGIPLIAPGDDVCGVIVRQLKAENLVLLDGDVIVVAQKIISKAEGRYLDLNDVTPSAQALELAETVGKDPRHIQAVLSESTEVVRFRKNILIVAHRLGFVMANAGIDESNIDHAGHSHRVLLLPRDPDRTCAEIKRAMDKEFGVSIGVIINDSFGRPWRNGVVGVALGCAGLPALATLICQPDFFGRPLQVTEVAVADELAAAASILMGQGAEGAPVVHIRGFKRDAPDRSADALVRPKNMDMFR